MNLIFSLLAVGLMLGPTGKLVVNANGKLVASSGTTGTKFYSPVTVNSGQVPTTQTDYPVRIFQTDARFKTVANGGHVANPNGFDIRPYSDAPPTTPITDYELAYYDGTNGIVEMYVKRSSLADGNVTYLAYDDPTLTTDASTTATWSNNYFVALHLKDGTTLSVADATGSWSVVNNGATATAGQIDGGAALASASSQYIDVGNSTNPSAITYSAWVNGTSFPSAYNAVIDRYSGPLIDTYTRLMVKSNGKLECNIHSNFVNVASYDGTGTYTLSTGTWYHVAMTYDSVSGLVGYVNAAVDNTVVAAGAIATDGILINIGRQGSSSPCCYWNGKMDEPRVASVARSADWIAVEYNEGFPATFETLGAEVAY